MPRPVQIRASYRDDAAYLLRLEEALSKDTRQTNAWRKDACELVRKLSVKLLQADTAEQKNGGKKPEKAAP